MKSPAKSRHRKEECRGPEMGSVCVCVCVCVCLCVCTHSVVSVTPWSTEAEMGSVCVCVCVCVCAHAHMRMCSVVSDCDALDCGPPGSSVHGILQVRILEWVAMPFSGGSS